MLKEIKKEKDVITTYLMKLLKKLKNLINGRPVL